MQKKKLFVRLAIIILFIFFVNVLAGKFFWYSTFWWFDMPMHFLGGLWIALMALWLALFSGVGRRFVRSKRNLVWYSMFMVFIMAVAWELFEIGVDAITRANQVHLIDSVSDIFYGLAGGLVGAMYFIDRKYAEKNEQGIMETSHEGN